MLLRTSIVTVAALQLLIATGGFLHVEGKVGFGDGDQDWGHVTVRPQAHMFWWLHYTTSENVIDVHDKPLLIWLQGGPGVPSTGHGNFVELGTFDLDLNPRNFSWVKNYNVLFVDNPVGTGYSYVDDSSAYVKNNTQIATDLLECMRGFLMKLPKFKNVPTYITTESYGGKMGAEFALMWAKAQMAGTITSNLKGVALGDPWISPIDSVLSYAFLMLETGFVDNDGFKQIDQAAKDTKIAVDHGQWATARDLFIDTMGVISNETGNINFFNILYKVPWSWNDTNQQNANLQELMEKQVSPTLGLNMSWEVHHEDVFHALAEDFMKPATDKVEMLLNDTDIEVFVYTGQLDLIASTAGTLVWVEKLKWKHSNEWHNAARNPLFVNGVIEGYLKEYRNFKLYWISRAGHMAIMDNPDAIEAILKHLTYNNDSNPVLNCD